MRFILAAVSLVIAALFLWYCATIVLFIHDVVGLANIDVGDGEMQMALVFIGGSFVIGLGFLIAGIAVLATGSQRKP